jgi:hypothetical protein
MPIEFKKFPKIPRLFKDVVITEKLDGTNAQIIVDEDGNVATGSRERLLTSHMGKAGDNYGFAAYVKSNEEAFRRLGKGNHYGEWWGCGINRGYGLTERRFSLFNTYKELPAGLPGNVNHVPVLATGTFSFDMIQDVLHRLRDEGSIAVPGYMNPEGIVIFHGASGQLFKFTFDGDGHKNVDTRKCSSEQAN